MAHLRSNRALLALVIAGLAVILTSGAAGTPQPPGASGGGPLQTLGRGGTPPEPYAPDEVLLRFKPHTRAADRQQILGPLNALTKRRFKSGGEVVKLGRGVTVEAAIERLRRHPLIEYAEPNYVISMSRVPDDPYFPESWALANSGQTDGTPGVDISAPEAWDITTGSRDVIVAVIDSGMELTHPDLIANVWTNPDEIPGNYIDDDGNGYVDDLHGWDFTQWASLPWGAGVGDDLGHGTHVSGIIAATGDNGTGLAGVNWKASLMTLKFIDSSGYGYTDNAVAAVEYAVEKGARVINASWGSDTYSQALYDAVAAAGEAGVLFVASAGNEGWDLDDPFYLTRRRYPASFDLPLMLTVAASDSHDELAYFSNFGATSVDLAAPGVDILSTLPGQQYGLASGTSMAAPHVSGAAALIWSARPGLSLAALRQLILDSVEPIPDADLIVSGGRLDVARPLAGPETDPPGPIDDLAVVDTSSTTLNLRWTATGDDGIQGNASRYDLRISTTPVELAAVDGLPSLSVPLTPAPPGTVEEVEIAGFDPDTDYWLVMRAEDDWGNRGPAVAWATGRTLPAPEAATSPVEFDIQIPLGVRAAHELALANVGQGTLDWSLGSAFAVSDDEEPVALPIAVEPRSGRVLAGEEVAIELLLDASAVSPGSYQGELTLETNAPGQGVIRHSLTVTILDAPVATVALGALDLGFPIVGGSVTVKLEAVSSGTLPLLVEVLDTGHPDLSVSPPSLELNPGDDARFLLTVTPSAAGPGSGILVLGSNAPASPRMEIPFTWLARLPPRMEPVATDLSLSLPTGGQEERSLHISNTGDTDLTVDISAVQEMEEPVLEWNGVSKGAQEALPRATALNPMLDPAGYRVRDSRSPDGPMYQWIGVASSGRPLDLTGDDEISDPIPLGFSFPFYGIPRNEVRICSNGWLSFGDDAPAFSNPPDLPALGASAPADLIAPFFDDLDLEGDQRVFVLQEPERFVVQYTAVRRRSDGQELTFQVMLEPGGRVLFQYKMVPDEAASATVGIQSAQLGQGLPVSLDSAFLQSETAVELTPLPLLLNGSFEDSWFLGWELRSEPEEPLYQWQQAPAGFGYWHNSMPVDGAYSAYMQYYQRRTYERRELSQQLNIPASVQRAVLSYADRIQYDSLGRPAAEDPLLYRATIQDTSGDVLETIVDFELLFDGQPYTDLGLQRRTIDLTGYRGQTILIHIETVAPGTDQGYKGLLSIELDDFRLEAIPPPDWLQASESTVVVPPGESRDVTLRFQPGPRADAHLQTSLRLATNDPASPLLDLPVSLTVTSAPDASLLGPEVTIRDEQEYSWTEQRTYHRLVLSEPAAGPASIRLRARGDFPYWSDRRATAYVEGYRLGHVQGESGIHCADLSTQFELTALDSHRLLLDGVLDGFVEDSSRDSECSPPLHGLELAYRAPLGQIDFGSSVMGSLPEHPLEILNRGAADLHVLEARVEGAGFSISQAPTVLSPGATSSETMLRFDPPAPGVYEATLILTSDDPDEPSITVPLRGTALAAPALRVTPESLDVVVHAGSSTQEALILENSGAGVLEYTISTDGDPGVLDVPSGEGTVPSGGSVSIPVYLSAAGLNAGGLDLEILVRTNDPLHPEEHVPVALTILGEPDILLGRELVEVSSSLEVPETGITRHDLVLPEPFGGSAWVILTAQGRLGQPDYYVDSSVEGLALSQIRTYDSRLPCLTESAGKAIGADVVTRMLADGVLSFTMRSSEAMLVDPCDPTRHELVLKYARRADRLPLGLLLNDTPTMDNLTVTNLGSDTLHVSSVAGDTDEIQASPGTFDLPPGFSRKVVLTILPTTPGDREGTVTIASDDPDTPQLTIPWSARVESEPFLTISPGSVSESVLSGESAEATLVLRNTFSDDITWSAETLGEESEFLAFAPSGGVVPGGETTLVSLTLSSVGIPAGEHLASINIQSDDPVRSGFQVPVGLSVTGVPRLTVHPQSVTKASFVRRDRELLTRHLLASDVPPDGSGVLEVSVEGSYCSTYTFDPVSVQAEGHEIGRLVDDVTGAYCSGEFRREFPLSQDLLEELLADGKVNVEILHPYGVSPSFSIPDRVWLRYPGPSEQLPFGTVLIGAGRTLRLSLENAGTGDLEIRPATSPEVFSPSWDLAILAPGDSRNLDVTFVPAGTGLVDGQLTLTSNDPEQPLISIPMQGEGLLPPVPTVEPGELDVTLPAGGLETLLVRLGNTGGSPLEFSAQLPSGQPRILLSPSAGTIAPGEELELEVRVDASEAVAGLYQRDITFKAAHPLVPDLTLPISVIIVGESQMDLDAGEVSQISVQPFSTPGAITHHRLTPDLTTSQGAVLEISLKGNFASAGRYADITVEGRFLDRLTGPDAMAGNCTELTGSYALEAADLPDLLADGVLEVDIRNSAIVDGACTSSRHTVHARFAVPDDPLDFGTVFTGEQSLRYLRILNPGTDQLQVTAVETDSPAFEPVLDPATLPLTVAAGGERTFAVRFQPTSSVDYAGTVTVRGTAPGTPELSRSLVGRGQPAPVLRFEPAMVIASTPFGGDAVRYLTVFNDGEGVLTYSLQLPIGISWLTSAGAKGSLQQGQSADIPIYFWATGLLPGTHQATVTLASNDPQAQSVDIPVVLNVLTYPDIALRGGPATSESTRTFAESGASTSHHFFLPESNPETVELRVQAVGEFRQYSGDYATVYLEDESLGTVSYPYSSGGSCVTATSTFTITGDLLADVAADGVLQVEVRNQPSVQPYCAGSSHTVTATFPLSADPLDFGLLAPGVQGEQRLTVLNEGQRNLEVMDVSGSGPGFSATPSSFTVVPGQQQIVTVFLTPTAPGPVTGTLRLTSNDPDEPEVTIALTGAAGEPEGVTPVPDSLSVTLPQGAVQDFEVTLINPGTSAVRFLASDLDETPGVSRVEPAAGVIPAGGETVVSVTLATAGIAQGNVESVLVLVTNNPAQPEILLPISLTVNSGPLLEVLREKVILASHQPYVMTGNRTTTHTLTLTAPVERGALLRLLASGDLGLSNEYVTFRTLSGQTLGTIGNLGGDCARGELDIPLTNEEVAALFPGGVLTVQAQATSYVSAFCSQNWHRVQLFYDVALDVLDLGVLTPGTPHTETFLLQNSGLQPLSVESVESSVPELAIDFAPVTIESGESVEVAVTATLASSQPLSGEILIRSNSGLSPVTSVRVIGAVAGTPALTAWPESFDLTTEAPTVITRELKISNLGGGDLEFAVVITPPEATWLTVLPGQGAAGPAETVPLEVRVDAGALTAGTHLAQIHLFSNDSSQGDHVIPVSVQKGGRSRLLLGGPLQVESSEVIPTSGGQTTHHSLRLPAPVPAEAELEIKVRGDYGSADETTEVRIDGEPVTEISKTAGGSCVTQTVRISLAAQDLQRWLQDSLLDVDLIDSPAVSLCNDSLHALTLEYRWPVDSIQFQDTFLGGSSTMIISARNTGNTALVLSLSTDPTMEYTADPATVSVAASEQALLQITFQPVGLGLRTGSLFLSSNDPDQPLQTLPLAGAGLDPPVARIEPASLAASAPEGLDATALLTLFNDGGSPLEFELEARLPEDGGIASPTPDAALLAGEGPAATAGEPGAEAETVFQYVDRVFYQEPAPPVTLACNVGDPENGFIYGLERNGHGFYRFRRDTDVWERLADSPIISYDIECGMTMLKGQVYLTAALTRSRLSVYDPETDSWSTRQPVVPEPANGHTAAIASDGTRFIYLGFDGIYRYDTERDETTRIPLPDGLFIGFMQGTLIWDGGNLYATTGRYSSILIGLNLATGQWFDLPAPPYLPNGGPLLAGGALDPVRRELVYAGPTRGHYLFMYGLDTGIWNVATLPFFNLAFSGPVWLDSPLSGIYVAGTGGLARMPAQETWIDLPTATGSVPPHDSLQVLVALDARDLRIGDYQALLKLRSNDVQRPEVEIPVDLEVTPRPDIRLGGIEITHESVEPFHEAMESTIHSLPLDPPCAGPAALDIEVTGDFSWYDETASVVLGGTTVAVISGGEDCQPLSRRVTLTPDRLAELSEDGALTVEIANSDQVDPFCPVNEHRVRMTCATPLTSLDLGEVFTDVPASSSFTIRNLGHSDLVLQITPEGLPGLTTTPAEATLPYRGELEVPVALLAASSGPASGSLRITSNDPDEPVIVLPVTAQVADPPVVAADMEPVVAALPPRSPLTRSKSLQIENDGAATLQWQAELLDVRPAALLASQVPAWDEPPKGEPDPGIAPEWAPLSVVGPDPFGYRMKDSDEPDGPRYRWIDMSVDGVPLWLTGDDQNSGPVPLGFAFPFYGETFDSVRVCTNGWLSFTSSLTSYGNTPSLPMAGHTVPENLLAPFWDDLDMRGQQRVFYRQEPDRFIVEYRRVDRYAAAANLTFQVVLHRDGRIVYQYRLLEGDIDSATIGIQDGSRTMGLLAAANRPYLHEGMAIEFARLPDWVTVAPAQGAIAPGETAALGLDFTALALDPGTYHARLRLSSNDPASPQVEVPVTLHAREVALTDLEVEPHTLNLSAAGNTVRAALQLPPEFDPSDVRLDSLRLNGVLPIADAPVEIEDGNRDGIDELVVKFDRQSLADLLPEQDEVTVEVTGEVTDVTWFRGTDVIRTIRPAVVSPNGGNWLTIGSTVEISWQPPAVAAASSYSVALSRDGGASWEMLAEEIPSTTFQWTVSGLGTTSALIRVFALDRSGVMGFDTSDGTFLIVDAPPPAPHPVTDMRLLPGSPGLRLSWSRPPVDPDHGPALDYRVRSAPAAQGPFTEIASTTVESALLPEEPAAPGVLFYKVIATNTGGEAPR